MPFWLNCRPKEGDGGGWTMRIWFVDGEGWTHVWAVEEGRGEEQGGEGFVLCVCVVWVWPRVT